MENDLILRYAAIDALLKQPNTPTPSVIRRVLRQVPTVDAVEVVKCRDCKHWHKDTGWCNQHSHFIGSDGEACHPWESANWKMFEEDDFCSDGERRVDDDKGRT